MDFEYRFAATVLFVIAVLFLSMIYVGEFLESAFSGDDDD